ncbi:MULTISPECIES: potassium/proton antiporter [unclassified Cyanobium]|uniref:potassium/proton antiporter n=1 Tax=unclassified Cyanobium TaxID=2627006 RepID=UPI0020CC0135|nr:MULTISPECIES: potassium/proton antiporter [unclassified Cyanobium]MCP9860263.1 potassium/proton antiporter [Cyanobium sp. Cruz-8H5]MCP9867084.1 potassium/proton antiporter [Cyanobium sp. Cruz-8D1]
MWINLAMLLAGVLLLLGIASSKFSARLGVPVLVLFLSVGMLAGSEGLGRIPFENYSLANSIGSVALALILFDGGLRTSITSVQKVWKPALALSTIGVLITSLITGLAAAWVLKLPLLQGLLVGSIVGSTDAAAVFSVLRSSGLKLPERLTSTLEVESGSNDPMAIFLTLGLIGVITGTTDSPQALLWLFVGQFGVGTLAGLLTGRLATWSINRINLDYPGLYPLLALAFGLVAFGLAAVLGGSGFLAVYIAGIVLGSSSIVFRRGIFSFHDATAWLGQIVLFVMLGLLSFPSRLLAVAWEGLLIALVLILVARPLAVWASALPFQFRRRELTFLSWVGLKGAVPITLATFPLLAGVPKSGQIFNAVFFVVLISAITQGWSLPLVARWLQIGRPADPTPAMSVEINALRQVDGEILDYTVKARTHVAGQRLRDLALPDGVVVSLILRGREVVMPRGTTVLMPGDHVFVAMRMNLEPLIDRLFDPDPEPAEIPPGLRLSFHSATSVEQLHRFLGLPVPHGISPERAAQSLGFLLAQAAPQRQLAIGAACLHPGTDPDHVAVTLRSEKV